MEVMRFGFVLQAMEPIAHHAETIGNEAVAMRAKVRQPGGGWAHVPIVTGDTMRHQLREGAAYATLDAAGMLADGANLSEGALRLLFAGGTLGGKSAGGGTAVKLDRYRELCDLFPPLALLGGAAENRIIPGRLECGEAMLVCTETAHLLPAWAVEHAAAGEVEPTAWDNAPATPARLAELRRSLDTHRAHIEAVTRVRMDPMLMPERRLLLADEERARVEGRLLTSEAAKAGGDIVAADDARSTMLPRSFERVCQGSLFYWQVSARVYSPIDRACFLATLATALYDLRVGGKRGTGHGRLRAICGSESGWVRPAERATAINPGGIAREDAEVYRAHVRERADALRAWLAEVDA